jgi:hypothetical protein
VIIEEMVEIHFFECPHPFGAMIQDVNVEVNE